jgi:tetratricopeptide (TPR) repeat protein
MLTYKRLNFDDRGIKKGSRNDYVIRWDDVTSVSTVIISSQHGKYYKTNIAARTKQSISFEYRKGLFSFSKLPGYGKALEFVAKKAPGSFVCEKTKYVAKWGQDIGSIKKLQMATGGQIPNIEDLKSLGNLHLVRFYFRRAKRAFRKILEFNPNDADALEGIALIDTDLAKSPSKIIPQYEHLVSLNSNHVGYLRRLTTLMLDTGDPQGENYASRLITLNPGEIQGRLSLAFYNLRKGILSEAKTILLTIERIANDIRVKEYVRGQLAYLERYEMDAGFRKKEDIKRIGRTTWAFILKYVVPALIILAFLLRLVLRIFNL